MKKRIVAALLAAVMGATALVGCGGSQKSSSADTARSESYNGAYYTSNSAAPAAAEESAMDIADYEVPEAEAPVSGLGSANGQAPTAQDMSSRA